MSLFHRYAYIYKPITGGSWLSADEQWKLTDSEMLKAAACVHPKYFIGCRAGKSSRFAVLDIDNRSQYHNLKSIEKLRETFTAAGIKETVVYRSSYSEGWHLYIFFDEPIASADLRQQLVALLQLNGFEIAKGTLEVFPSPGEGTLGQGLRMPLQPGWGWLDQRTLDLEHDRNELSATRALEWFLDQLESGSNSYTDFRILKKHVAELASRKQVITSKTTSNVYAFKSKQSTPSSDFLSQVKDIFTVVPPGINPDDWWSGRNYYEQGLTGPSQRAHAVFCLGHYLFYGDPSRGIDALGYGCHQEREWVITEILAAKHNGYSKDISRGRREAAAHVERATRWVPPHKRDTELQRYTPTTPIKWIRHNANQQQDARKRITEAVEYFKENHQPFSMRDLKSQAKCSEHTLQKHEDLWKQAQVQIREIRLQTVAPEYNAGVGAVSSENQPPTTSLEHLMPPGRLAARRICYEISMRTERERRSKAKDGQKRKEETAEEWKQQVLRMLPVPLEDSDTIKLQAVLALSISLIARSPDEEMEVWLSDIIRKLRTELKARSGKLTLVPSTEPDGSLNFDPNYVDDPSNPPFCPGNELKAAQGRVLDW
jgi:hypothetical protein